jgi:hypothetical protein
LKVHNDLLLKIKARLMAILWLMMNRYLNFLDLLGTAKMDLNLQAKGSGAIGQRLRSLLRWEVE